MLGTVREPAVMTAAAGSDTPAAQTPSSPVRTVSWTARSSALVPGAGIWRLHKQLHLGHEQRG